MAVIYSGGVNTLQVFIDGNFDSTENNFPSPNPSTQAHLNIGSDTVTGTYDFNGKMDDIRIYNRALATNEVQQLYAIEYGPHVNLLKAVKPSFSNLSLGTNYQLQASSDLITWTNQGAAFPATNASMVYPQYFDVGDWNQLFFRLQVSY